MGGGVGGGGGGGGTDTFGVGYFFGNMGLRGSYYGGGYLPAVVVGSVNLGSEVSTGLFGLSSSFLGLGARGSIKSSFLPTFMG